MAAFVAVLYWLSGSDPVFVILQADLLLGLWVPVPSPFRERRVSWALGMLLFFQAFAVVPCYEVLLKAVGKEVKYKSQGTSPQPRFNYSL